MFRVHQAAVMVLLESLGRGTALGPSAPCAGMVRCLPQVLVGSFKFPARPEASPGSIADGGVDDRY
ncbi:hypothetical protein CKO25_19260 [Thiocapsa imhoffii]|uniref:Uncharacterized protein n=1 Tax=Thiocapsa imhoffii TaxID=382777 RepID=A0A9X0WL42_9GAMM|nr:hypothetical protein [Thiocapsa imhoffii]